MNTESPEPKPQEVRVTGSVTVRPARWRYVFWALFIGLPLALIVWASCSAPRQSSAAVRSQPVAAVSPAPVAVTLTSQSLPSPTPSAMPPTTPPATANPVPAPSPSAKPTASAPSVSHVHLLRVAVAGPALMCSEFVSGARPVCTPVGQVLTVGTMAPYGDQSPKTFGGERFWFLTDMGYFPYADAVAIS